MAKVSRRSWLGGVVACGVGGVGMLAGAATARAASPSRTTRPRAMNVIFAVSDGMSLGTLTLADAVLRHRTRADSTPRGSIWLELMSKPSVRRALASVPSADSHVPDSAAAGSAWGIGRPVNNKSINVTPDGLKPTPILVHAAQQGKATGLVTTTTVTHATPASFLVNWPVRDAEHEIAREMMARGCDVILGGGSRFFPPATLGLRSGVSVVRTAAELTAELAGANARARGRPGPLLGLFADGHMAYELDRPTTQPELAVMAKAALTRLESSPHGFVLQVEGGRVDHAAHRNDAAALVHDQLAFERALAVLIEFTESRDDTLLLVTTDHGNANPSMTMYGPRPAAGVALLDKAAHSFEWIGEQLRPGSAYDGAGGTVVEGQPPPADTLAAVVKDATGVTLEPDELAMLRRAISGEAVDPFAARRPATCVLGSLLANHTSVAFLSENHTADLVEVTAMGPGSEMLKPVIRNWELHGLMIKAMDLAPAKPV